MKQLLRSFVLPIVIGISACSGSETVEQSEPASNKIDGASVLALSGFLDEFYSGRAYSNITAVVEKYTEWPDFGPGDSITIARDRNVRVVAQTDDTVEVEVKFAVVGEESGGKTEFHQNELTQVYRLKKRGVDWKIQEPIYIPCISISAQVDRLREFIQSESERIAKGDLTTIVKEYSERLITEIRASITVLEAHR